MTNVFYDFEVCIFSTVEKTLSNNKLFFQINNKRLFSVLIEDIISI